MIFVKGERHHVSQTTTLGAPPPLILGFHPSKRHAALIASCDQGSIVLVFTLVLLVLKRFLWRVVLVILMFVAWLLVDSSCFCCLPSTNIMLFLCGHILILCNSHCIELVAQRQHPASFLSSRSYLLWFVLILKNWRNIC